MVAVVLGASAINEVRQGEILSGLVILAVALGVAGLWHLVRRYADRP